MTLKRRAEQVGEMEPLLIADVYLYPTARSGRKTAVLPGWGCPCMPSKDEEPLIGCDGWPQLGDTPMAPGDTRRLGFVFLSGDDAVAVLRQAGAFYLWEGQFIGEARVVSSVLDAQN